MLGGDSYFARLKDDLSITAAEGVREAVFAGMGLCVTTVWMFQTELEQGRVRQVLADWSLPDSLRAGTNTSIHSLQK